MYRVPEPIIQRIRDEFPQVELVKLNCPGALSKPPEVKIYWGNRIDSNVLESQPSLEWIHFGSVGINRVANQNRLRPGTVVTSSKGLVTSAMVGTAVGMVCSLARGLQYSNVIRQRGDFTREAFDLYFHKLGDLEGQKALIVGMGEIGERLAIALNSLSMEVAGIRRDWSKPPPGVIQTGSLEDLEHMVSTADFIINLLPLGPETQGVFSSSVFRAMKRNSFFVNLGRGETVDESALLGALMNQEIAGAGLDVFANEPLSRNSDFLSLDNVLITPHVAGASPNYWSKQEELFFFNLRKFMDNEKHLMRNVVDLKAL
jgi:phosphoglycerate dehydrogenase-like enzyme